MPNKVTPCVTMVICVAGCGTTTSTDFPYQHTLPPPVFKSAGKTDSQSQTDIKTDRPDQTIDTPAGTLEKTLPPVLKTTFQKIPETVSLQKNTLKSTPPPKPFFTPLAQQSKKNDTEPFRGQKNAPDNTATAGAMLLPLLKPMPNNVVVIPEAVIYPRYIQVGPEYFGPDSEIAPYVISRAPDQPGRDNDTIETRPLAILPKSFGEAEKHHRIAVESTMPLPQQRPAQRQPQRTAREKIIAKIYPIPVTAPGRTPDAPQHLSPVQKTPIAGINRPELPVTADKQPKLPLYRVKLNNPGLPKAQIAGLSRNIGPIDTLPTSISELEVSPSDIKTFPKPRQKPHREDSGYQIAGTASGVTTQPYRIPAAPPANDRETALTCLVNRGSGDRMILVCEGVEVSKSDVFRAVVEGESAFRGLRSFNTAQDVIKIYGFNNERFNAMSHGPQSARDIAFLRALRNSGRHIRVKGRQFDLYLMRGDLGLATVLIEQVSDTGRPAPALYN